VGILFRLILQGILAYVLKKGAVSSSQAAVSTGQAIIQGGARAAADEILAEVSTLLRNSKLPDGFVVWLEKCCRAPHAYDYATLIVPMALLKARPDASLSDFAVFTMETRIPKYRGEFKPACTGLPLH